MTNDHYYIEGTMRFIEGFLTQKLAPWTDAVHMAIEDMEIHDPSTGIAVSVVLPKMHGNNGLGHTSHPNEVAASGTLI